MFWRRHPTVAPAALVNVAVDLNVTAAAAAAGAWLAHGMAYRIAYCIAYCTAYRVAHHIAHRTLGFTVARIARRIARRVAPCIANPRLACFWTVGLLSVLACWQPAHAAGRGATIYRCAGPPTVFTSDARLAASLHCRAVQGRTAAQRAQSVQSVPWAPHSGVLLAQRGDAQNSLPSGPQNKSLVGADTGRGRHTHAAMVVVSTAGDTRSAAPSALHATVPRALQSQRDKDRERILHDELARERERLQTLTASLSQAQAQGVQAEVERLRQSARRSASDVDAISREIARNTRF
jgi:hypothetical protein